MKLDSERGREVKGVFVKGFYIFKQVVEEEYFQQQGSLICVHLDELSITESLSAKSLEDISFLNIVYKPRLTKDKEESSCSFAKSVSESNMLNGMQTFPKYKECWYRNYWALKNQIFMIFIVRYESYIQIK